MTNARLRLLALLLPLAFLAACRTTPAPSGPNPPGPPEPDATLVVRSDTSLLFQGPDESRTIDAVVQLHDGSIVEDAVITFEVSDPSVASVEPSGSVTSHAANASSAVITVRSGDLTPVTVGVAVVGLAPDAVYVEADSVVRFDPDSGELELVRDERTEAIAVGTVLISGSRAGLLVRVTQLTATDEAIVATTVPASLTDAVLEADVEASGAAVDFEASFEDGALTVAGAPGAPPRAQALARPKCVASGSGSPVDVTLAGLSIAPSLHLAPRVRLVVNDGVVERFDALVEGEARVHATVGEIGLSAGVQGSVDCSLELPGVALGFVPLLGPVGVGPTLQPGVGVALDASYTLGEVHFTGPVLDKGLRVGAGLGYTATGGYEVLSEVTETGEGAKMASGSAAWENAFEASVEPYMQVDVGIAPTIAGYALPGFDFLRGRLSAEAAVALSAPVSADTLGYTGPTWELTAAASLGLEPIRSSLAAIEAFLDRLGLEDTGAIARLDLEILGTETLVAASPSPALSMSAAHVQVGAPVDLRVQAEGAGDARVDFIGFLQGEPTPRVLARATANEEGSATATWTPEAGTAGTYDVAALVYHGPLAAAGLPYSSGAGALLDVASHVEVLEFEGTTTHAESYGVESSGRSVTINCGPRDRYALAVVTTEKDSAFQLAGDLRFEGTVVLVDGVIRDHSLSLLGHTVALESGGTEVVHYHWEKTDTLTGQIEALDSETTTVTEIEMPEPPRWGVHRRGASLLFEYVVTSTTSGYGTDGTPWSGEPMESGAQASVNAEVDFQELVDTGTMRTTRSAFVEGSEETISETSPCTGFQTTVEEHTTFHPHVLEASTTAWLKDEPEASAMARATARTR